MDLMERTGVFKKRSPFRRDKEMKIAGPSEHTRAPARFCPGLMRKVCHDNIHSHLRQAPDAGGDQRRRFFLAPETVNQCADRQISEVMIASHPLARHHYPSRVTLRASSTYPDSNVTMIVRGIDNI